MRAEAGSEVRPGGYSMTVTFRERKLLSWLKEGGRGCPQETISLESHGEIWSHQSLKSLGCQAIEDGLSSMGRGGLKKEREGYKESRNVIPTDKEVHRLFPILPLTCWCFPLSLNIYEIGQ